MDQEQPVMFEFGRVDGPRFVRCPFRGLLNADGTPLNAPKDDAHHAKGDAPAGAD